MNYLDTIDHTQPGFGEWCDELSLWSAPFGLWLLERVPMKPGLVILDVGAGTGFLTIELAQRCGPGSKVIAVDPWNAAMDRLRCKVDYLGLANVVLLEQDAAAGDAYPGLPSRHFSAKVNRHTSFTTGHVFPSTTHRLSSNT